MMKKVATAVLGLVGLVACAGEGPVVDVRIDVGFASSRASTVEGTFMETAPGGSVTLRLVGQGQDVEVRSGESVTLPVGEYAVSGHYEPEWDTRCGIAVGSEPSFDVDCALVVRNGVDSYTVPCEYSCWALVMDGDEVREYRCDGVLLGVAGSGRYGVAYILDSAEWTLTVVPWDDDVYGETDFAIRDSDMEDGKWYMYSAGRLWQSGGIGIDFPDWVQGW